MYRAVVSLWLLVAMLSPALPAVAQSENKAEEAQIQAVVQSQEDAWNRGDAPGFAAHYAADGSFTNVIGQQLYGREAFIAQHARIFATIYKGSHNTFSIGKIKFVRPDVAIVDIDGALSGATQLPPGLKVGADGAVHVKLQEVMTKENGSWQVAAFHNVAVVPLPPASRARPLLGLTSDGPPAGGVFFR